MIEINDTVIFVLLKQLGKPKDSISLFKGIYLIHKFLTEQTTSFNINEKSILNYIYFKHDLQPAFW